MPRSWIVSRKAPCIVGALLDLPELAGRRRNNPAELVGMLLGSNQAIPVKPQQGGDAAMPLLNRVLADAMEAAGALNARAALAAPALGAGWPCSLLELAVWRRLRDGLAPDPDALAASLLPDGPAEERARLAQAIGKAAADLPPLWRSLGLLG